VPSSPVTSEVASAEPVPEPRAPAAVVTVISISLSTKVFVVARVITFSPAASGANAISQAVDSVAFRYVQ